MSDYKRFVSYFYPYTPDKQPRSVGFVKIEVRDKRLKFEIQIKGIPAQFEKLYPVYLFSENGGLISSQIGTIKFQKNGGGFRGILREGDVGTEKFPFTSTIGIIIEGEDNVLYIAYWGKQKFSINEIIRLLNKKDKPEKESIEERDKTLESRNLEQEEVETNSNIGESVGKIMEDTIISKLEVPLDMKEKQFEERIQEVNNENYINSVNPELHEQGEPIHAMNDTHEQRFFENSMFFDCKKIEPKDLRLLPTKEWILGKNSFLLHGYYNYRHLLYGKVNKNGNNYLFLGVPGVFHNQEKFMANLFGFSEFEPVKNENIKTGRFGYWIRIIDKI